MKLDIKAFLISIIFLSSCTNSTQQKTKQFELSPVSREFRIIIPDEIEKTSIRGIDYSATKYNLSNLRETVLPDDDIEIRIRLNFTNHGGDMLVLKRIANQWNATRFRGHTCDYQNIGKADSVSPK